MRNAVIAASVLGLSLLAGCPDRTISEVTPQQGRVDFKDIPININRNVDILFLIDDSPSMMDKQTNLKNNFKSFIDVLNSIKGGLPNVHIGVVSSDLGSKAADGTSAPNIPGCSSSGGKNGNLTINGSSVVQGTFISDVDDGAGGRSRNYSGTLADAFASIAQLGVGGCGFEQQIEATKRALSPGMNAGFLRSDAYLAIVYITDEDDCSMEHSTLLGSDTNTLGPLQSFRCTRFGITCDQGGGDSNAMNQVGAKADCHSNDGSQYLTKISEYATFFKSLKSDPKNVIMAAIAGNTTPVGVELRAPSQGATPIPALARSCTYQGANGPEVADPAIRIKQLLDQFPDRSTFSTICQQDLSGGLTLIAQLLATVIGSPCIEGKLADADNDPSNGTQYDCSVSDITKYGKPDQKETVLPECNNLANPASSSNIPCWAIEMDPMCTVGDHLTLKVERGSTTPPDDTHVVSYCVTEAN